MKWNDLFILLVPGLITASVFTFAYLYTNRTREWIVCTNIGIILVSVPYLAAQLPMLRDFANIATSAWMLQMFGAYGVAVLVFVLRLWRFLTYETWRYEQSSVDELIVPRHEFERFTQSMASYVVVTSGILVSIGIITFQRAK